MSLSHTLKMLLLTADATSPDRDQQLHELSEQSSLDRQEVVRLFNAIAEKQDPIGAQVNGHANSSNGHNIHMEEG